MQVNVHGCDRSLKETVLSVRYELRSKNSYLKNKKWDSLRCEIRSEAEETADDVITTIQHECKSSEQSWAGKTVGNEKIYSDSKTAEAPLVMSLFHTDWELTRRFTLSKRQTSLRTTSDAINPRCILVPLVLPLWPPCWSFRLSVSTIWRQSDLQRWFFRCNVG
jgi:hypothetical protein